MTRPHHPQLTIAGADHRSRSGIAVAACEGIGGWVAGNGGSEMNDTQILEQLRAARELLATRYVKEAQDDGKGGHCALGCIAVGLGRVYAYPNEADAAGAIALLNSNAMALHPEINFNRWQSAPIVQVNNRTNKESTLAVFDAAILELEIKLASSPPEAAEPVELAELAQLVEI